MEIEIVDEIESMLREIEQALLGATAEAGETFRELRIHLRAVIVRANRLLEIFCARVLQRIRQFDRLLRESAWVAAGIAMILGSCLGMLALRSQRKHAFP